MRHPVTIDAVERVLKLLGFEWRGEWQLEIIDALLNYDEVAIQASRQVAGKTFTTGIYEATRIMAGNTVTVAYPTITQGSRLLAEKISGNLMRVNALAKEATGKKLFRQPRDQALYQRWQSLEDPNIEGKFYVLSANEIKRSPPEGYTTDDLDYDESHRLTEKSIGIFEPFTDIATEQGNSTIAYLGVGGHKTSLLEIKKLKPNVRVVRWPASRIRAADSRWSELFDRRQESMPPWQWRMHYECEQCSEGLLLMFPQGIPPAIDMTPFVEKNIMPVHFFGIDLGKKVDATIVKVISVVNGMEGKIINEIDEYVIPASGVSYVDQERMIYEWINGRYYWRRENIILELSGVGESVIDIFHANHFRGCRGITTSADLKKEFWHDMSKLIREGRFGCKWEKCRNEYEGMTYENVFRNGKYELEFEHTDYWMALCMAWTGATQIEVL